MNDEKFLNKFVKNGNTNSCVEMVEIPFPEELLNFINKVSRPPILPGYNVCYLTLMGFTTCLSVIKKYFKIIYESSDEGHYIVKIPQTIPLEIIRSLRGVGKVILLFEE